MTGRWALRFTWGDHTGAHVAMWMTYHRSAVPPGCCICHSCDVQAEYATRTLLGAAP